MVQHLPGRTHRMQAPSHMRNAGTNNPACLSSYAFAVGLQSPEGAGADRELSMHAWAFVGNGVPAPGAAGVDVQ